MRASCSRGEMADTLALEASAQKAWGFKSLREHQSNMISNAKGLIDRFLISAFPSRKILNPKWLDLWNQKEFTSFTNTARIFFLTCIVVYGIHYWLVDLPAKKDHLKLWALQRAAVVVANLFALVFTYTKWHQKKQLFRIPLIFITVFIVYMQSLAMSWRPDVPHFYIPLQALLGVTLLRLSPTVSLFIFLFVLSFAKLGFIVRPGQNHLIVSASILAGMILILFRTRMHMEIDAFISQRESLDSKTRLIESQQNFLDLSKQVAHDLRSPIAALSVLVKNHQHFSSDIQSIITGVIERIQEIGDQLIYQKQPEALHSAIDSFLPSPYLQNLTSIVNAVVVEKKFQYSSDLGENSSILIVSNLDDSYQDILAKVHSGEFKRVLSNIIDNGIESISQSGTVQVLVSEEEKSVLVSVRDSGKGIPISSLSRLGEKGFTQGKLKGMGLGLFHAKGTIESWGGSLSIQTTEGKGTLILMRFPKVDSLNP